MYIFATVEFQACLNVKTCYPMKKQDPQTDSSIWEFFNIHHNLLYYYHQQTNTHSSYGNCSRSFLQPIHCDFLLLEVSSVLFINQHKIQKVLHAEFVINVVMSRRQLVGTEEQSDWYWLTWKSNQALVSAFMGTYEVVFTSGLTREW